jgi:uroporphyrinogen-III synthase
MTARRVLVTRPLREATRWVEALRERGLDAQALPLLAIEALADEQALREARAQADRHHALMFVSAAAVEHFFGAQAIAATAGPRCWATGPGTAAALRAAGVAKERIDVPDAQSAQFDSESLWRIVQPQVKAGTPVLIVRGGDAQGQAAGRDWLAREIEAAGGQVDSVVAYRRVIPAWTEAQREQARAGARGNAVWLFSSSQALTHLQRLLPGTAWGTAQALATHPRIAQAARDAGFGSVKTSSPELEALVASIESLA